MTKPESIAKRWGESILEVIEEMPLDKELPLHLFRDRVQEKAGMKLTPSGTGALIARLVHLRDQGKVVLINGPLGGVRKVKRI